MIDASNMIAIDETFHPPKLIQIIAAQEHNITVTEKYDFFIFLTIMKAASRIKIPTAILIPLNAFAITDISKK